MDQTVITVEGVSKRYQLGLARHDTLRDRLAAALRSPLKVFTGESRDPAADFWALRDVSFKINRGDVVGIIGRNGAGKSTLLKILSRITDPTTGTVRLRGRVSSLLEVGTGFHPELTGRENVRLNGAILGMSSGEIRRKFDEIIAFAGIERFVDTPVKHYSSGMYVRLAFSVAAHLEPDILIIDEVLAVGDAAFQKKCLGKMESVSQQEGRTILFVSHNLHAIRQLCRTAIMLNAGRIETQGRASDVIDAYSRGMGGAELMRVPAPPPDLLERAYFTAAHLETIDGRSLPEFSVGEPWQARLRFKVERPIEGFVVAIGLVAADGLAVQSAWADPRTVTPGNYEAVFHQNAVTLAAGSYTLFIGLSERERVFQLVEAARLHISNEKVLGYYQATSGVGIVLNSMKVDIRAV
jgi:lipopolysaccharide transport system ATP-binding protein